MLHREYISTGENLHFLPEVCKQEVCLTTKRRMAKEMQVVGGPHLLNNPERSPSPVRFMEITVPFKGNHYSAKKEITLLLNPYNGDIHFIV